MNLSRTSRVLAPVTAAGVLALTVAAPASAHVTVTPSVTAAGGYTVVTVSVPHGCDGSATKQVVIDIPEEILSVTPTRNALWTVAAKQEKLAEPVKDSHGNEITDRDAQIIYTTDQPLADDQRDVFELSLKLPEVEAGTVLYFPTVQNCEQGKAAWVEIATEGQDPHELEHPAPSFTVTAAEESGHGDDDADMKGDADKSNEADEADEATGDADDTESEGDSDLLGGLGLGAGLLGLLAGGAALVMVRRKQ